MAKDSDVSLFEQHVEKLVLGLCVVLLAFVLIEWVLSSPERVPVFINGHVQPLPPAQVDSALGEEAKNISLMFQKTTPPVHSLPDYENWISGVAAQPMPLADMKLADMGVLGQQITETNKVIVSAPSLAELAAAIPAPAEPLAKAVMQLSESDANCDVQAIYGACKYPWAELKKNWEEKITATVFPMAALGVEVEIRHRLPEGTWGPPRNASLVGPLDANKAVVPVIPNYDGANSVQIHDAIEKFLAPDCQQAILTPTYPKVYNSATATFVDSRIYMPRIEGKAQEPVRREPNAHPPAKTPAAKGEGAAPAAYPKSQIWFQDDSLELGVFYQCRVRLVLLNPLYADEDDAKTPADAGVRELRSPWSNWSNEQIVYNPTRFFLAGRIPSPTPGAADKFQVAVFTHKLGQPVREVFTVDQGEPIGGVIKDFKVYSPAVKREVTEPTNFSTGAICVKSDFEKTIAKARSSPLQTAAMIVLDEKGDLDTRLLSEDEKSKTYKELEAEVKRSAKPAGAAAP